MRIRRSLVLIFLAALVLPGCASQIRKGTTPEGNKVYLPPQPIEETKAFKDYQESDKDAVDKLRYLLKRVVNAPNTTYYRNSEKHAPIEAYRGAMWLMRNRYEPGTAPRDFLRDHVWRDPDTDKPYLAELPDGSLHVGYHILLNELEFLERKTRQ